MGPRPVQLRARSPRRLRPLRKFGDACVPSPSALNCVGSATTEESIGRLPYGSSYILKALAKLDSMLSKLARVTEEQLDEQKNVVPPDNHDQTSQSAVMQPTAPAIPEPGELEIEPPDLQPTPPIELPPDSPSPPEVPPHQPPAQPPQPPQMKLPE
jgi:hypothetical protein